MALLNVGETITPKHFAAGFASKVKYYGKVKIYIQNKEQKMSVPEILN
jgi:hypothetical protein